MTQIYSAIRMRREIRDATNIKDKLKWIFQHADRIQEPGYDKDHVLLVFREIIKTLRELAIVELPKGPSGEGKLQKLAKAGVRVVFAALVDAGASAVVGQFLEMGARGGAKKAGKKAAKKTAAKKAAKTRPTS